MDEALDAIESFITYILDDQWSGENKDEVAYILFESLRLDSPALMTDFTEALTKVREKSEA